MIEQNVLMRLAREYADRKIKEIPSLRAIVLAGSVARGEPALGDAVDIDILLIDDHIPDPAYEVVRLSENVFIDATFVRVAELADRKALRMHHYLAPALNDALILHDPRHYFDILQASVRAPYNKPDNIYARARSALTPAQRIVDRFTLWREDPPADGPSADDLNDLRQALYLIAQSIILLSGQPGDAVGGRKFMVRFEAASRQHNTDLYPLFLETLGIANLPVNTLESLLPDWLAAYKAANQQGNANALIHSYKRGYYERGFKALAAEGHALNTLWLFEHTLAACVQGQNPAPAVWGTYLQTTGKADTKGFIERIRQAENLTSLADETLNGWAKRENVDW
jgi:hypothetical protein